MAHQTWQSQWKTAWKTIVYVAGTIQDRVDITGIGLITTADDGSEREGQDKIGEDANETIAQVIEKSIRATIIKDTIARPLSSTSSTFKRGSFSMFVGTGRATKDRHSCVWTKRRSRNEAKHSASSVYCSFLE